MSKESIVIGIAGGTGSGKSTMVRRIEEEFGPAVSLLSHDFYYKEHNELSYEERCLLNYDHPNSFDTDLLIEHIKELRQGKSIYRPVYDFTIHNRSKETVEVKPAKVIIVEGILIFENQELLKQFDIKLYIDTDAGCADYQANCTRCKEGSDPGICCGTISHHCENHARTVRRTKQSMRILSFSRRRPQRSRTGYGQ